MKEEVFYNLSLLSYFDSCGTGISVSEMIQLILSDEQLANDYSNCNEFQYHLDVLKTIPLKSYEDIIVKDCYDDNMNSGVVYYVFEYQGELIFAFRGSEPLDDIHHTTGWQDWMDNFRMFFKDPTYQQVLAQHQVMKYAIQKPFYLCGHSKGGNLALFTALTISQERLDLLKNVISFNAPGITRPIIDMYKKRAQDSTFQDKLMLFENENDCVSSFFEHLKEPIYIHSDWPCTTFEQLYHNHYLYAMDFKQNMYVYADKKTAVPKLVYHFVNDFFVNLKEARLQKVVAVMDDYFNSGLSKKELYRVLIYHISQYTALFEDIEYDEISNITLQDLIERRKTKFIREKMKDIQPKEALKKTAQVISNVNPINKFNELDIKVITQGFLENYELLKKETSKNIQEALRVNNEKIAEAIKSFRSGKENEKE